MESTPGATRPGALVFDFGRVITRDQDPVLAARMGALLGVSVETLASAYYGERTDYDRGLFGAGEYWSRIARRLGVPAPTEARIADLAALDMESWFVIDDEMTDFIAHLRGRIGRLVLLSNIPFEGRDRLLSGRYPWVSLFDALVLSCDHLSVKPERPIYDICVRAAGVPAEHCLFVDDIERNIEGARAAGMRGHVYSGLSALLRDLADNHALADDIPRHYSVTSTLCTSCAATTPHPDASGARTKKHVPEDAPAAAPREAR